MTLFCDNSVICFSQCGPSTLSYHCFQTSLKYVSMQLHQLSLLHALFFLLVFLLALAHQVAGCCNCMVVIQKCVFHQVRDVITVLTEPQSQTILV